MKSLISKPGLSLLFFCVFSTTHAERTTEQITYTDDGVPIRYGSVVVSKSNPVLSKIPLSEAPRVRAWMPGDPIKEIPRIHWREVDEKSLQQPPSKVDPLLEKQKDAPWLKTLSAPSLNQDGQGFSGVNPPDTVGDVGVDYYIQGINGGGGAVYTIYNKSDGTVAAGPTVMDSLGSGNCASGLGDPIVLYDELASRWMISEFSSSGNQLCIYISQTSDPTQFWHVYAFTATNGFPDYPKYGVWSNAYYMGSNESAPTVYAFDRANMLAGNAATLQSFNAPSLSGFGFQMLQPADLDGSTGPSVSAPGLFFRHRDTEVHGAGSCTNAGTMDCLEIFEFDVDWNTPANSSLSGPITIEISEIDSSLCGLFSFNCFQQDGSGTTLDPLREVVMWRAAYRNFGTHESIVGNLVTDVDGTDHGGIRWFELRDTGSGWGLHDEGTFAPDAESRWMGSVALDKKGNMAIGYNRSSSSSFPSLAYTGRLSTDTAGTLESEQTLISGSAANGSNRYGDYSSMSIDPVDGCTFWFTGEYNSASQWSTRIANFSFSECFDPSFSMSGTNLTQEVCVNPSANLSSITLDLVANYGFSETVTLAFDPALPTGFSSAGGFSPASLTPPGSSSVDIAVNNTATLGLNTFQITGSSLSLSESVDVAVLVRDTAASATTLTSPANTATGVDMSPTFSWSSVAGADSYLLQVSDVSNFSNIVYSQSVVTNSHTMAGSLSPGTTYYWRVATSNACGGLNSSSFSFTTVNEVCTIYNSTDVPKTIASNPAAGDVSSVLVIGDSGTITDVNAVNLTGTHTWMGDISFRLSSPAATEITLMNRDCGGTQNWDVEFDDEAASATLPCPPADGNSYQPATALSTFDGENLNGTWTFIANDAANQDGGSIDTWGLEICYTPSVLNTYTVSGSISGASGSVTVQNNGGDDQTVALNGAFSFTSQNDGAGYEVTVSDSPATQTCTVTGGENADGTGTLNGANVSDIAVTCNTNTYTVSGSVSGATGSVSVQNNNGDTQVIPSNGPFSFSAQNDGTDYEVTVSDSPATQTCSVTGGGSGDGSGTLGGSNITNISVICTDNFSTAEDDSFTVNEDSLSNALDVTLNDSASFNGALVTIVTQGSNGSVSITNAGADVSYSPDENFCGNDSFSYTLNGGSSATVNMTVNCVNDEPGFALDSEVHVRLDDVLAPLPEVVACQFDMGPDNEDITQSVNDFIVNIDSDPNGILSSVDVLNDGSLSASYSGQSGTAIISVTLQDDGGTDFGGDDSVTQLMQIHVRDYIYRGNFDLQTCQ